MFSIPAAGLAKTLIGVTISLHGAPAHHVPGHYTVRPGDTLSDIARQEYGSRADWPALWWTNRHNISNPDAIVAGQKLRLSTWHPHKAWLRRAAMAAAGPVLAAPSSSQSPSSLPVATSSYPSYSGGGVNWDAIAACESGGNPRAIGGGGAFRGKYQFTYETWAAMGGTGDPAAAPEAVQDRLAAKLYASAGAGQWPVCGR